MEPQKTPMAATAKTDDKAPEFPIYRMFGNGDQIKLIDYNKGFKVKKLTKSLSISYFDNIFMYEDAFNPGYSFESSKEKFEALFEEAISFTYSMAGITKNADPVPENSFPENTTKNDVPRCTLTDAELLEKCREWITKLCNTGGRAWVMHVPARLNDDPDLLFGELTWRFKKMLRAGSRNIKNDDAAAHSIECPQCGTIGWKKMDILNEKCPHCIELEKNDISRNVKNDDNSSLAEGVKLLLNKVLFKLPDQEFNFIMAEANDLRPWTNAEFFIKNDLVEYRLLSGETTKNDDTAAND